MYKREAVIIGNLISLLFDETYNSETQTQEEWLDWMCQEVGMKREELEELEDFEIKVFDEEE